jgi:serine protease AprX
VARTNRAAAVVAGALVSAALSAAPAASSVTAVASGDLPRVNGVTVVSRQDALGTAVVRGTPLALRRLASSPGVRGVYADDELRPSSGDVDFPGSVFAWQGVGGSAGRPGAGAGVRVAVVDTGIADTPALNRASGRLVDALNTSRDRGYGDGYGHGTFMAGIIAGGPVPGTGPYGVGVAPGATVLNVKVADDRGTTRLSDVLEALDWVADHARSIDVASFAFSRPRPGTGYGADPLTDAVEAVRSEGVTIAVSAGNDPDQVGDPGFAPTVLTVGAADVRDGAPTVAPFSGSGVVHGVAKPDVVGSGMGVLSVLPAGSVIARENPAARRSDLLWRGSGTSEATAQVAGTAALFLAAHPSATPADVKASLRTGALRLSSPRAGAGLVRAGSAFVAGTDANGDPTVATGEASFDAEGWDAMSWRWGNRKAGSWSRANGWSRANSWSRASSWSASSWSRANSWSASSWSRANSWSANSWSANSWSASSWSASSWSAAEWGGS